MVLDAKHVLGGIFLLLFDGLAKAESVPVFAFSSLALGKVDSLSTTWALGSHFVEVK